MTVTGSPGKTEFLPPAEIRAVQERLLKSHLEYAAATSPFYRHMFLDYGIDVSTMSLAKLHSLPFTDKSVVSDRNDEFLAVPMSSVVDIVLSSGTTGRSTKVLYTENDLRRLAYNEEISFSGCGITSDDVVLLTCTIDRCFIAGLAYFSGIRNLGAAAIRNGLSSVDSHLEIIKRLKPTAIVGVPTFLLKLGKYLISQGVDPAGSGVRRLVCIGEPIRDCSLAFLEVGYELERIWGARIFSTYASSETITSFCECTAQCGGHLHPDLAVVEIVSESGEVMPYGTIGEVVVTPLGIEGMPLVRYKTGDVSFLIDEACTCGRNSIRLGPIIGRKNQMLKYRGTTIYPNSIYAVLDTLPEVNEYYVSVRSGTELSDEVRVHIAPGNGSCSPEDVMNRLQARLRVRPEVIVADEDEIRKKVYSGNTRKPIRFIDERKSL